MLIICRSEWLFLVPDVLFQQGKRLVIQLDFISMTTEHNVRAVTLLVSLAPQYRIRQQFTGRGSLSVSEPRTDPTDYQSMMGRSGHLIGVAGLLSQHRQPPPGEIVAVGPSRIPADLEQPHIAELTQALAAVGITVDDNGKLSVDTDKLKSADMSELKKMLGSESELMKGIKEQSGSVNNIVSEALSIQKSLSGLYNSSSSSVDVSDLLYGTSYDSKG